MKTKIYYLLNELKLVRYVGKTGGALHSRLDGHIREALNGKKSHKCCWIRSMLRNGLAPTIELQTEVNGDGCGAEIAYIKYLRGCGLNLTNETDGGEGASGHCHTKETREKIRDAIKGIKRSDETRAKLSVVMKKIFSDPLLRARLRECHKGHIPWNRGLSMPEGTGLKISKALKGKKQSAETRANMSFAHKNSERAKKHVREMIAGNVGRILSATTREKIGQSKKGRKRPPFSAAWKKHMSDSLKGRPKSEAHKAKIGLANKGRKFSAEQRSHMGCKAKSKR